jgi:hypothetical protein
LLNYLNVIKYFNANMELLALKFYKMDIKLENIVVSLDLSFITVIKCHKITILYYKFPIKIWVWMPLDYIGDKIVVLQINAWVDIAVLNIHHTTKQYNNVWILTVFGIIKHNVFQVRLNLLITIIIHTQLHHYRMVNLC